MERVKHQSYSGQQSNNYFWRTYDKKELDWVEESGGRLHGYEFKWGKSDAAPPRGWLETYTEADFQVIHPENYLDFVPPPALIIPHILAREDVAYGLDECGLPHRFNKVGGGLVVAGFFVEAVVHVAA